MLTWIIRTQKSILITIITRHGYCLCYQYGLKTISISYRPNIEDKAINTDETASNFENPTSSKNSDSSESDDDIPF